MTDTQNITVHPDSGLNVPHIAGIEDKRAGNLWRIYMQAFLINSNKLPHYELKVLRGANALIGVGLEEAMYWGDGGGETCLWELETDAGTHRFATKPNNGLTVVEPIYAPDEIYVVAYWEDKLK